MKEQLIEQLKEQLIEKIGLYLEVPDVNPSSQEAPGVDELQAWIALRAYELYEQEGCCDGYDVDHWLKAEREILESVHGEILSTDASAPIEPAHGEFQIAAVKVSKREVWIRNSKGFPTL